MFYRFFPCRNPSLSFLRDFIDSSFAHHVGLGLEFANVARSTQTIRVKRIDRLNGFTSRGGRHDTASIQTFRFFVHP
eukprot:scaffold26980_cov130-Amphora_coffeaeformis.AAC.4